MAARQNRRSIIKQFSFLFVAACICSCGGTGPVLFPVKGTNVTLAAQSREAAAGLLDYGTPKKLEYRFVEPPALPPLASLEIEYDFSIPPSEELKTQYQLVLALDGVDSGAHAWALPMDLSFLGPEAAATANTVIHYAVPIAGPFTGRFSIALTPLAGGTGKASSRQGRAELPRFQIRSLEITGRRYGYYREHEDGTETAHVFTSPFVFGRRENGRAELVIEPPRFSGAGESAGLMPELLAGLAPGREAIVAAADRRYEALPGAAVLRLPGAMFAPNGGPLLISGDRVRSFWLSYAAPVPFPVPVTADPGLILDWPREQWRDRRFELFRWEQFPSLLLFDTADYAVQDRLFKRLAFFTEKAGYRGRLASDEEIAALHGWNAHDYRAEDLARFFETARTLNFPLLGEERELERILLDNGIIRRAAGGGLVAGAGGVISISRESAPYLRSRFMVHEAFHGIFFIDEDFRTFSRQRWERLDAQTRRFITSYFDFQHYDITDEYLLINEFMAHILQQPVSQAGYYFGQSLPARLETSAWRRTALPPKEESSGSWPALAAAFAAEAEAFSTYVNRRWGLSAGRVRQLTAWSGE
jgi:hypothetical protein